MTKPFSVSELLARVEALCRRRGPFGQQAAGEQAPVTLVSGSFVLDENRRVLLKAGQAHRADAGGVPDHGAVLPQPRHCAGARKDPEGVWGENYFGDVKIVDVNIRRLRMKVEDEPSHPTHIMTVWGYGYRWENKEKPLSCAVPDCSPNRRARITDRKEEKQCAVVLPTAGCGEACS